MSYGKEFGKGCHRISPLCSFAFRLLLELPSRWENDQRIKDIYTTSKHDTRSHKNAYEPIRGLKMEFRQLFCCIV